MEIINALGHPTIAEFSSFVNISPPNAAYKINSLIQKGYITKSSLPDDKREYHLSVTQKYIDYYNVSYRYLSTVMDRIKERFPAQDVEKLEEMLNIISDELMPELNQIPLTKINHRGAAAEFCCRTVFCLFPWLFPHFKLCLCKTALVSAGQL